MRVPSVSTKCPFHLLQSFQLQMRVSAEPGGAQDSQAYNAGSIPVARSSKRNGQALNAWPFFCGLPFLVPMTNNLSLWHSLICFAMRILTSSIGCAGVFDPLRRLDSNSAPPIMSAPPRPCAWRGWRRRRGHSRRPTRTSRRCVSTMPQDIDGQGGTIALQIDPKAVGSRRNRAGSRASKT